jgi:hypothetical protein
MSSTAAEHAAALKVDNDTAGLAASHDAHASSSTVLNEGLGLLAEGFKLTEEGNTSKKDAVMQGHNAENFSSDAESRHNEAADLNSQGTAQFGVAAEHTAIAARLFAEGQDRLSVAELLAQVADIDNQAGEKLAAIAGFTAEAAATMDVARAKAQRAVDNDAAGQGLLQRSQQKFSEAGDAFKAGRSLKDQAKLAAQAEEAIAKQQPLDAQGE